MWTQDHINLDDQLNMKPEFQNRIYVMYTYMCKMRAHWAVHQHTTLMNNLTSMIITIRLLTCPNVII